MEASDLMAKKLSKIQKLMRDRPEMFDYGDCPPNRVLIPAQEKWYDDNAPDWVKRNNENAAYRIQLEAENEIKIAAFKANFKACR
jgi:hypothetical protein